MLTYCNASVQARRPEACTKGTFNHAKFLLLTPQHVLHNSVLTEKCISNMSTTDKSVAIIQSSHIYNPARCLRLTHGPSRALSAPYLGH
jgi:hypothetical protein